MPVDITQVPNIAFEPGSTVRAPAPSGGASADFEGALQKAVSNVEQLQQNADAQAAKVSMGEGNLHEMAMAMEKADIGLRVMTKARNKLVEAYQEVMRMQV
jgi:flagellar hook-basal body complex protein FliE